MIQIQEGVAVLTNHDGEPVSFDWGGASWLVSSRPVRWYARKTWWQHANAAPKGIGAQLIETEMWRLRAISTNGAGFFELQREADFWQLSRWRAGD